MSGCCAAEDDYRDYLLIHGLFYDLDQGPGVGVHGGGVACVVYFRFCYHGLCDVVDGVFKLIVIRIQKLQRRLRIPKNISVPTVSVSV